MRKLATTKTPEISGRSLFSPFLLGLQERSEKRGKRPEAATWRSRLRFGAARLSEPRAADFFVYVILRALGPLLADVQIPPRVRGDWYTQREYSLRSWRSRPRFGAARLSEHSRRGLISNMVIRGRSVRFSRMYRSPRGCGGIGTPSENRTRISGSGGQRSIHYPMGADDVCKYTILKSISQV